MQDVPQNNPPVAADGVILQAKSPAPIEPKQKMLAKRKAGMIGLIVLIAVVVALAFGLGFGLGMKHSSSGTTSTTNSLTSGTSSDSSDSTTTTTAAPTTPTPTPGTPSLTSTASTIEFMDLYYSESATYSLKVCNTGTGDFTGSYAIDSSSTLANAISVTYSDYASSASIGANSFELFAGTGCATLTLSYNTNMLPTISGDAQIQTYTSNLVITELASEGSLSMTIPISSSVTGYASVGTAFIRYLPSTINYGNVAQGTVGSFSLVVRNIGSTQLDETVSVSNSDFYIFTSPTFSIASGQTETVTVNVQISSSYYQADATTNVDSGTLMLTPGTGSAISIALTATASTN